MQSSTTESAEAPFPPRPRSWNTRAVQTCRRVKDPAYPLVAPDVPLCQTVQAEDPLVPDFEIGMIYLHPDIMLFTSSFGSAARRSCLSTVPPALFDCLRIADVKSISDFPQGRIYAAAGHSVRPTVAVRCRDDFSASRISPTGLTGSTVSRHPVLPVVLLMSRYRHSRCRLKYWQGEHRQVEKVSPFYRGNNVRKPLPSASVRR